MQAAQGFLDFVNASPSPFHAVATAAKRLERCGFQKVNTVSSEIQVVSHRSSAAQRRRCLGFKTKWEILRDQVYNNCLESLNCVASH